MRVYMKPKWWSLVGLCLLLPIVSGANAGEIDWGRLFQGDVVVEAVRNRDDVPGVRAQFVVTASRERIWSVLTDYDQFPQLFPGIKALTVLEQDTTGAKVAYHTPVAFMDYRYVLHRRYVAHGRRLTWARLSGSFQSIDGAWEILETPRLGVYVLVYESFVRIGRLVPTSLVQREALRRAEAMGHRLRTWIERTD